MIKESLKIHGHKQFEIKQRVSFDHAKTKDIKYHVETYFFLPAALQINPQSYSAEEFRRSFKNYVRLSPATHKLKSFYKVGGVVESLKADLEAWQTETVDLSDYENALKRIALTYKRSLRLSVKGLLQGPNQKSEESTQQLLTDIEASIAAYRALQPLCAAIEEKIVSKAFEYCDEYISWVTTYYLRKLITERNMPLRRAISDVWREEILYREENYPESIATPGESNEKVLYRWSTLRRYINRYLFLDISHRKGAPFIWHTIYAMIAAVSMIFTFAIMFNWRSGRYDTLSFKVLLIMVVAYIFRDRFKDIGKKKLQKIFQRWLPDRKLLIYKQGIKKPIGICRESFRFISHSALPDDVRIMHQKTYEEILLNNEREEDVLYYKKTVHLINQPDLFEKTRFPIADITRFNVTDFLRYIDVAFEELPFLEEDETPVLGEKSYHVYMIRRIRIQGDQEGQENHATELVRIVLNVHGIKRLEVLQPLDFAKK
ncbi:hypothetical protein J7560_01135 [Wohlfahrtiimonas chitiniclastica]|uniref:hypothetical protein n=1 Tax=Wohlfahrtiimonas chitiniclastica TaxID=400946 RepID=UPI001BCDDA23|nr:hypothetical protein [Wohlfahrtiimonas chitiniclastica]MBS7814027.1 hypothetical protein [Wohlfahrtiimonas chitiniclastica]